MKKNILLITIGLTVLLISSCSFNNENQKPNVILIMTDDQGYGDIAAHGNPYIKTPELDRLHDESIRLTDFHVNSFCAPTRAALMTGRMSDRTHVRSTVYLRNHLNRDETTMAEFFKASGYNTGHFGKWHLGENYPYRPMDRGFDQWVGIGDGGLATSSDFWGNDRMDDAYIKNGYWEKIKGFNTDVFFDETMNFIKKNKGEPFFVYLATNVPHGPMNVLQEWCDEYKNQNFKMRSVPWGNTKDLFASVTRIDKNLGRLRQFLAENKLDENTILIFLTDNGSANGAHIFNDGMKGGKGSLYEGGHRVPCFIHWPARGLNQAIDIDKFTTHTDLLPTLIELCSLKKPERGHLPFDGRSMVSLLKDKNSEWDDRLIFMHLQNLQNSPIKGKRYLLATEKWRLVEGKGLYDIKADPGQKNNLADQYPDVVKEFLKKYDAYWDEVEGLDYPHARPIIGSSHQEETWLNTISWVKSNDSPHSWNQRHILAGDTVSGFWPVEIAKDGLYQFEVRRWPKEINQPISASLPEQKVSDITCLGKPVRKGEGKAISVVKVRLKVGEQMLEKNISETDVSAVFQMQLEKGKTDIHSWFDTEEGDSLGAYYIYAKLK
ncbi:MAG: arylsulfatase [Bacteroidota bacterium]